MKSLFSKQYFPVLFGAGLEYYDIALYGFMAPILVDVFLPFLPKTTAYFYYFLFEFFAALCQLAGARVFGKMGDSSGRKKTMYYTMLGLSFVTFFFCILPTYQQAGTLAAGLFWACRALQSFFLGGEYNGGAIYCLEHESNKNNHGFISGLYCALTVSGIILAALISTLISYFGIDYFRCAYIFSVVFVILTFFVRKSIKETPEYLAALTKPEFSETTSNYYNTLAIILFMLFFGVLYGLPTRIFNALLPMTMEIESTQIMMINICMLAVYMILLVIAGKTADRWGPVNVIRSSLYSVVVCEIKVAQTHETAP